MYCLTCKRLIMLMAVAYTGMQAPSCRQGVDNGQQHPPKLGVCMFVDDDDDVDDAHDDD